MPLRPREINDTLSADAIQSLIRKAVKREVRKLNTTISTELDQVTVGVTFDGHGAPIQAGSDCSIQVTKGFTLVSWTLLSDETGSIQIDVWRDTYANFPPTEADTITGGNEPAITSSNRNTDTTLTGWTTLVADGDILKFSVDSVTDIKRATLILNGTRT